MWRSAIVLVIALAACRRPAPTPGAPAPPADAAVAVVDAAPLPLDQDLPRLALRGVELYEDIVRVFAATGTDCIAATAKLQALQPAYAEVAAANAKLLHEGQARSLRTALEPYAARLDAAAKTIASSATLAECSANRELADAFDQLVQPP